MVKILTYVLRDNKGSKTATYSRNSDDEKTNQRIEAESELSKLVDEGWTIVSTSSYVVSGTALGSTLGISTRLVVVLQK